MPGIPRKEIFKPGRTDPCFCQSGKRFKSCCGNINSDREPPHGLNIIEKFIDPPTCAEWVNKFEKQAREFVSIIDHLRSKPGKPVYRQDDARITERVNAGPYKEKIDRSIGDVLQSSIAQSTGRSFSWFIGPQILRYQSGGHYALHADSDHWSASDRKWVKGLDRDISILLYLNDNFSGGELEFPLFNYHYKPRPGDLLFFPSDYRYRHQAHPVEDGLRYVIVSWAAFSGEPRTQNRRPENRIDLD